MVLVGDAAHKVTPNFSWGYNSGVEDITVLVNGLRDLLQSRLPGGIGTKQLELVFTHYEAQYIEFLKKTADASGTSTRGGAWHSWPLWILDCYVGRVVYLQYWLLVYVFGSYIQKLKVLNWLQEQHHISGKMPFTCFPKIFGKPIAGRLDLESRIFNLLVE